MNLLKSAKLGLSGKNPYTEKKCGRKFALTVHKHNMYYWHRAEMFPSYVDTIQGENFLTGSSLSLHQLVLGHGTS